MARQHTSEPVTPDLADVLLYERLPALMHEHVCVEQALALQRVLLDSGAEADEVIDVLDDCWAAGSDSASMCERDDEADKADMVGAMARHLAQHHALLPFAPEAAERHLKRAATISRDLSRDPSDGVH